MIGGSQAERERAYCFKHISALEGHFRELERDGGGLSQSVTDKVCFVTATFFLISPKLPVLYFRESNPEALSW